MCCYSDIMVVTLTLTQAETGLSFPDMKFYNVVVMVVFIKIHSSFKQLPHHNSLTIETADGTILALKTRYC